MNFVQDDDEVEDDQAARSRRSRAEDALYGMVSRGSNSPNLATAPLPPSLQEDIDNILKMAEKRRSRNPLKALTPNKVILMLIRPV